jgi:hypothetical protein
LQAVEALLEKERHGANFALSFRDAADGGEPGIQSNTATPQIRLWIPVPARRAVPEWPVMKDGRNAKRFRRLGSHKPAAYFIGHLPWKSSWLFLTMVAAVLST